MRRITGLLRLLEQLYPLEIYVVVGYVDTPSLGVYWYRSSEHALVKVIGGDVIRDLTEAAFGQESVNEAAVNPVITAVYSRTTRNMGKGVSDTSIWRSATPL